MPFVIFVNNRKGTSVTLLTMLAAANSGVASGIINTPSNGFIDDLFAINLRTGTGAPVRVPTPFSLSDSNAPVQRTTNSSNIIRAMALNDSGLLVAVGDGGTIQTSINGGLSWVTVTSGTTSNLNDVVWNGSKFIVVGAGGVIRSSTTGSTWASVTSPTSTSLIGCVWTGTNFCAVTTTGVAYTSTTGNSATWTSHTTGLTSVVDIHANGLVICAISNSNNVYSLDGGLNWATGGTFAEATAEVVRFYSGYFVISGGQYIQVSNDYVNWLTVFTTNSGELTRDTALVNGVYYISTAVTKDHSCHLYSSTNGLSWFNFAVSSELSDSLDHLFVYQNQIIGFTSTDNVVLSFDTASVGTGGLIISKSRSGNADWSLIDTVRGAGFDLTTSSTAAQTKQVTGFNAITSSAIEIGTLAKNNTNAANYIDYLFRKAAGFIDIVTYSGNGTDMVINHNLGIKPGMIWSKRTDGTGAWCVWHKGNGAGTECRGLSTNTSSAANNSAYTGTSSELTFSTTDVKGWNGTALTSSSTVGNWISYLFADNQSMDDNIQCGMYTGNGSVSGPVINLGWEPQFLLVKNVNGANPWIVVDTMRSLSFYDNQERVQLQSTAAGGSVKYFELRSNGFQLISTNAEVNKNANNYIYMAIRHSTKPPVTGDEVFQSLTYTGTGSATTIASGILTDLVVSRPRTSLTATFKWWDRFRGINRNIDSSVASAQVTTANTVTGWDINTGFKVGTNIPNTNVSQLTYCFKRAAGFLDVVGFTGNGANQTVAHGLKQLPDWVFLKSVSASGSWYIQYPNADVTNQLTFDANGSYVPTVSAYESNANNLILSAAGVNANQNGIDYIAYLFGTVWGISKSGRYIGDGGSNNVINCSFSNGARFIIIKRLDSAGAWYVWDSVRGITSANDPYLLLNAAGTEVTTNDSIIPDASGFSVKQNGTTNLNVSGGVYAYLAIA